MIRVECRGGGKWNREREDREGKKDIGREREQQKRDLRAGV